jgi:hypothetical protein
MGGKNEPIGLQKFRKTFKEIGPSFAGRKSPSNSIGG